MNQALLSTHYIDDADRPFGSGLILSGLIVISLFISGLAAWGTLAPIESAVVAPGILQVDSIRKTVQHLSGGIVEQIQVREGDHVKAGDVLVRLQDTRQRAQVNQFRAQYFEALAAVARLKAERAGESKIRFPPELMEQRLDPQAREAIDGQTSLFESRRQLREEQKQGLEQRLQGLEQEVAAIKEQIKAGEKQMEVSNSMIALFNKVDKARDLTVKKLELRMDNAQIASDMGEMRIGLARANQTMLEKRLEYNQFTVNERKLIEEELRVFNAQVTDMRQSLTVAENELQQTVILANASGEVVGLQVHSVGGVIIPGQALMEIVPANDELVVETTIDVNDIDQVLEGVPAQVELTSANHRYSKPIQGRVKWVSADALVDPISGLSYYKARVELDKASVAQQNLVLQPGMAADVLIRTGSRSAYEYLMNPIARSLGHALREQ
jgi:HlyD family type I secretion membrane fusion protein